MKKQTLVLLSLTAMLGMVGGLASCGGQPASTPDPHVFSIPDQFSKGDDNAHKSLPAAPVETVRIHYHRFDDSYGDYIAYLNWSLWIWDMSNGGDGQIVQFNRYDDFGVYVDIPKNLFETNMTEAGFIVCCYSNGHWYGKDPDGDRSVKLEGNAPGGIKDIYLVSGQSKVFDDPNNATKPSIYVARILASSRRVLRVAFNDPTGKFDVSASDLKVFRGGLEITQFTAEKKSKKAIELTFPEPLSLADEITVSYRFDETWTDRASMIVTDYFDSEEFERDYGYEGNDLGVTFNSLDNPSATTFKVWAPTSRSVKLNLYHTGDYRNDPDPYQTYDMEPGDKGVFAKTIGENLDGVYYTYTVTNSKGTNEVVDPYARSAGLNGRRGMVVNFKAFNAQIRGWAEDARPAAKPSEASIYEIHVRDMTINPNSGVDREKRGKFLGLAQEGTTYSANGKTVSTGLDHLAETGVTHVQIQPFYDYSSVDETAVSQDMSDTNYNWGYDPQNYNALEGSYSSNPADGYARIKEFKTMMMAMHRKGLNVNMDVVYNHTSSTEQSNFQLLVPYYYYRTSPTGEFYNGSGCGNEVASDRKMVHDYVVDSTRFYMDEYHMSGFRFDLMGLEDNQTMIDVFKEAKKIYPDVMVYGEPWDMGSLKTAYEADNLKGQKTLQGSLSKSFFYGEGNYVGAFNDIIRGAIRGGNGHGQQGYVSGNLSSAKTLVAGTKGLFTEGAATLAPEQCINYASCHDNLTLHDQIAASKMEGRDLKKAINQANAIVALSQGVAFFQEGDDFLRTKAIPGQEGKYEDNSYNVGDSYNNMDYALKAANTDTFELFKKMLDVRAEHPAVAMATRAEIEAGLTGYSCNEETGLIQYRLNKGSDHLLVAYGYQDGGKLTASGKVVFDSFGVANGGQVTDPSVGKNQVLVLEVAE